MESWIGKFVVLKAKTYHISKMLTLRYKNKESFNEFKIFGDETYIYFRSLSSHQKKTFMRSELNASKVTELLFLL